MKSRLGFDILESAMDKKNVLPDYRHMQFVESRVPVLDALSAFVPTGHEKDGTILKANSQFGFSRWFPVDGGHKVLFLYEGGEFDRNFFTVEKGAWDHEHCRKCHSTIPAMTLCWATKSGPFIILCQDCHKQIMNKE
jgi:hypothetical protein